MGEIFRFLSKKLLKPEADAPLVSVLSPFIVSKYLPETNERGAVQVAVLDDKGIPLTISCGICWPDWAALGSKFVIWIFTYFGNDDSSACG
ncbi:hypothetical protein AYI68_g3985 [Smittium mucronatum]|uniref:Uncharacterized protein n=1 Tax=Smittium mucronatum TaxID=133383 RepID=A0A1R0GYC2_9FUNG|nr:hypothetical protein AYI68_g3985 [Smittium mucronatum]